MDAANLPVGVTPRPTPQQLKQFGQFVEKTIDPETTLDLVQGRPRLLILRQTPTRVQIGDENIASYTLITDHEVSVVGNAIGSTILNLWFADPQAPGGDRVLSYLVRVLPDPEAKQRLVRIYQALEQEINRNFPNSWVQLSLVGDKLVLRGEAKDIVEAAQILQVVGANAPGQRQQQNQQQQGGRQGTNINLQNAPFDISNQNQNMLGTPQDFVNAQYDAAGNTVANQVLRVNANIINLLRVPGEQQVMLQVAVAEVNRTAARTIGVNFNGFPNTANTMGSVSGGAASVSNSFPYVFQQLSGGIGTGNLPVLLDNGQISLAINALRSLQLARSLAEPNLVTTNGQPAAFQAGSEFPVPSATATFGAVGQSVTFVPFGVSLVFTPAITDHDRVRMQIRGRISTLNTALEATIGTGAGTSTSVPGLNARTFSTTVEMREGQTLAIAGLVQNDYGATTDRVPFFGDLPLLGTLFGNRSTSALEQELVVLVTPRLVHPLEACKTPPIPGADVFEPGDIEFYLFNRLESTRAYDFRSGTRNDWDRMHVYERCEEQLIIGAQGRTYGCCGGGNCQSPCGCPQPQPAGPVPTMALPPASPGNAAPVELIPRPASGQETSLNNSSQPVARGAY